MTGRRLMDGELDARLVTALYDTMEEAFPDRRPLFQRLLDRPKPLYWSVWQTRGCQAQVLLDGLPDCVEAARKLVAARYQVTAVVVDRAPSRQGRICRALTIIGDGGPSR